LLLARDLRPEFSGAVPSYVTMLLELLRIFETSPPVFPVTLQDFHGRPNTHTPLTVEVIRKRYFSSMPVELRKQHLLSLITLATSFQTPLELHLGSHGFVALAQQVKDRRLKEALHTLKYVGVEVGRRDDQVVYSAGVEADILAIPYRANER
jgi:hypothetical protein